MKAKIYLHIGLHKTGTSSIQTTFYKSYDGLLARGINYPRLRIENPNHSVTLVPLFHRDPLRYQELRRGGVNTREKVEKRNAQVRAALRQALNSNTAEKIVFSGEGLAHLRVGELEKLRSELAPYAGDFRVIVYVRDPYSTANSMVQQRVRRGQTYQQIERKPPFPRYSRIGASLEVFGRDNVDIRIFDKAQFVGNDLMTDFLSAVGADPQIAKELDVARTNEALSHEAAFLLHEINKRFPTGERDSANIADNPALLQWLTGIPGQPYRCPPELLQIVQPRIAREVAWLHGVLGRQIFPETPPVLPPPKPYWQDETLAAIALKFNDLARRQSWREWAEQRVESMSSDLRRLTRRWRY